MNNTFCINEKEITKLWQTNNVVVSIVCYTYNHENFIKNALDSFLKQKTTFPFEVFVHDDASTDKTTSIVRAYEKLYPNIIKLFIEDENQFSKHQNTAFKYVVENTLGEYLAFCEGDDYWIDDYKLQRQINFLIKNPTVSLSTENSLIFFTNENTSKKFSDEPERFISKNELLIKRRFATGSTVFLKKYFVEMTKLNVYLFDTVMWTFLSEKGLVHYNPVVSSVYRRGPGITETNKIKWLETVLWINSILENTFDITKEIKMIRRSDIVLDFITAYKIASKSNKLLSVIILIKAFFVNPIFFIRKLFNFIIKIISF